MKAEKRRFSGFVMRRSQVPAAFGGTGHQGEGRSGRMFSRSSQQKHKGIRTSKTLVVVCMLLCGILVIVTGQFLFVASLPETTDKHEELEELDREFGNANLNLNGKRDEKMKNEDELSLNEKDVPMERLNLEREILVLGFHHSGTSILTRLMIELGIYAGESRDLLMLPGNKLKYFELKSAVDANKDIIASGKMDHGPWWLGYGFDWNRVSSSALRNFKTRVKNIVEKMRQQAKGKSWLIKDPRLCAFGEEYMKNMKNPVCVIVWRNPLEVSLRMLGYNTLKGSLSVKELAEIWEQYMVGTVANCLKHGADIIYAPYSKLVSDPRKLMENIHSKLADFGVALTPPLTQENIDDIIGADFVEKHKLRAAMSFAVYPSVAHLNVIKSPDTLVLSERAMLLLDVLEKHNITSLRDSSLFDASLSPWSLTREEKIRTEAVIKKQAYVTMLSSDAFGYLTGAMVLAASIRRFDSRRDMVAMLTQEVSDPRIPKALQKAGWIVKKVPKLPEPWFRKHPKCNGFNAAQIIRWGRMFSKLNLWSLEKYSKVVYVDTDTLILRPIDKYFALPRPFYAERSPSHGGINAGIIVTEPSKKTLQDMLEYGQNNEPLQFFKHNQVGCTEQELFNRFWHGENVMNKLNDTRHADYLTARFTDREGREELKQSGATIAHWLTTKCPKPWAIKPNDMYKVEAGKGRAQIPRICDHKMYEIWHHYYWSTVPVESIDSKHGNAAADIPEGLQTKSLTEMDALQAALNTPAALRRKKRRSLFN